MPYSRFTAPGSTAELERRGVIAVGRIEDYSAGVVFRHEQTLAKPKADRLELLRATQAHFGQLFMLYSDPAAEIDGMPVERELPGEIVSRGRVRHEVAQELRLRDVPGADLLDQRIKGDLRLPRTGV